MKHIIQPIIRLNTLQTLFNNAPDSNTRIAIIQQIRVIDVQLQQCANVTNRMALTVDST